MKSALFFASLLFASLTANAATFQGSTSGIFENPTGPGFMVTSGEGTNQFSWGFPLVVFNDPSALTYSDTDFDVEVNNQFSVGQLSFFNGLTVPFTEATSVDL